ncbi:MAG: DUF4147 domain-containing protein [Patescibacteria group bacterium]|nr:DUF4147 domain-containing protein [Patescibacteria group bacterium]MDE2015469.1 DUF4147 domain-containing protein [Patescibacteria group bacterium]MDE2226915.1 DUF4147 domain-containing protein [Patescibacteria group bacterium]
MNKIKNLNDLATTDLRRAALNIAEAGLAAIDTDGAVKRAVRVEGDKLSINNYQFDLASIKNLYVVGVGKCSLEAGAALEDVLGERITGGIVIDVHKGTLKRIQTFAGSHPLPTDENMDATKKIIDLLDACKEDDLVIFIISGGGSTLLCQPTNRACSEEAKIFNCLTDAGADITELNTVRKHISLARGGFLAKYAYPARSVSLVFSDVPGNDIEFVASGPTMKDTTTIADAQKVIARYDKKRECDFVASMMIETPKEDKYFEKVANVLVVSNDIALQAMADEARRLGFSPQIMTTTMNEEAQAVGRDIAEELKRSESKTALLYGGETTVSVKSNGRGGRNLQLALSQLTDIKDGQLILTLASDGRDNGEFAGAICDKVTLNVAEEKGIDIEKSLQENNSYPFFELVGNYIVTGDTGSNVSDLVIAIKE